MARGAAWDVPLRESLTKTADKLAKSLGISGLTATIEAGDSSRARRRTDGSYYQERRPARINARILTAQLKNRNVIKDLPEEAAILKGMRKKALTRFRNAQSVEQLKRDWLAIAERKLQMIRARVAEGRSVSGQMAPLKPKYKKLKDKLYPGKPILVATGAMLDSLAVRLKEGGRGG